MGDSKNKSYFSRGNNTLKVPMSLFRENRERLCGRLQVNGLVPKNAVIVMQGGSDIPVYSSDDKHIFRQEAYFQWLFGILEPHCYGAIHVATGETLLFVPKLHPDYAVIMGRILTLDDFKAKYEVDKVYYTEQIAETLKKLNPTVLLTLYGVNTDSNLTCQEATFEGIEEFEVNNGYLHPEMVELRVHKTPAEVEVMRYVNKISSDAHKEVMRGMRPDTMEYQSEAKFLEYVYNVGGCRHVSYTCICGSGVNSSVLHYGHAGAPNDKMIKSGDMCLFDMGADYYGYTSDITCSFPATGKFTEDQKLIYNAVLRANGAVIAAAKPGVSWLEMHRLANRVMLGELRTAGLLKGEVEDMMAVNLAAVFQPHGLGHLMGLDVHDVGGYGPNDPPRPSEPGENRLRTARDLEEGMVITVEPGCYFIDPLLDEALEDPKRAVFLVPDVIKRFRNFGGVRIEDDVLVTKDGVDNLTKVPRTVEAIEALMAGTSGRKE